MFLFEGYMGTILHTGDFRFTPSMMTTLPLLYPPSKLNSNKEACSIHIDELIMDDTYCDPVFQFPKRVYLNDEFVTLQIEVCKEVIKIIEKNKDKRICIAIDTVGKEELLLQVANEFKTKVAFSSILSNFQIAVSEAKYTTLQLAEYYLENFTIVQDDTWIEVIRKFEVRKRLREGCVVIVPTGWCNDLSVMTEPNHYVKF